MLLAPLSVFSTQTAVCSPHTSIPISCKAVLTTLKMVCLQTTCLPNTIWRCNKKRMTTFRKLYKSTKMVIIGLNNCYSFFDYFLASANCKLYFFTKRLCLLSYATAIVLTLFFSISTISLHSCCVSASCLRRILNCF